MSRRYRAPPAFGGSRLLPSRAMESAATTSIEQVAPAPIFHFAGSTVSHTAHIVTKSRHLPQGRIQSEREMPMWLEWIATGVTHRVRQIRAGRDMLEGPWCGGHHGPFRLNRAVDLLTGWGSCLAGGR